MSIRHRICVTVALAGVIVLGGAAGTAQATDARQSHGRPITASHAVRRLAADTAEFSHLTATYAKTMTLGELSRHSSFDPSRASRRTERVIVAVGVGQFVPGFGHGESFSWGAMVFDRKTGFLLGTLAEPGSVPRFLTE